MKPLNRFLLPFALFLLGSCFATNSIATTLTEIVKDMMPIEALVVEANGNQIILNLGSNAGVHKNDLFTVFSPGRQLTDPKTGKVLGQIESRTGIVSVTKVETAFSFARPLGRIASVKRGDKLVRFKDLTAVARDTTGKAEHFIFELQQKLQSLDWQDNPAPKVELTFIHDKKMLKVMNKQGRIIREYQLTASAKQSSASASTSVAPVYATSAAPVAAAAIAPADNGKIRYDMQTYGYNHNGSLPFSAIMGDFLMIDQQMHLAVIQKNELAVYQVQKNSLTLVAKTSTPLIKQLAVCWWQPGPDTIYIGVTGYDTDEEEISSSIFRYSNGTITNVKNQLPWILNSSDLDGDGHPETMLAQDFDRDIFFGRRIVQLHLTGNTIKTTRYKAKLPLSFHVTGGTVFQSSPNSSPKAAYIAGNKLHIAQGSREIYTSSKEMGGSGSALRYVQNPGDFNPLFSTANIEVRPLAVDIDNDGNREILVASADLSSFTTVGGGNNIKKSWLSVLKMTKAGTYMKGKIGGAYDQYIQAIGAANGTVYLLTVNPVGLFSQDQGGSQLLALPLKD